MRRRTCSYSDQDCEAVDRGRRCGGGHGVHERCANQGKDRRDDEERHIISDDGHEYALGHYCRDVDDDEWQQAHGRLDSRVAAHKLEE